VLKRKLDRGGITPEEYDVEKKKLLEEHLGGKKQQ